MIDVFILDTIWQGIYKPLKFTKAILALQLWSRKLYSEKKESKILKKSIRWHEANMQGFCSTQYQASKVTFAIKYSI